MDQHADQVFLGFNSGGGWASDQHLVYIVSEGSAEVDRRKALWCDGQGAGRDVGLTGSQQRQQPVAAGWNDNKRESPRRFAQAFFDELLEVHCRLVSETLLLAPVQEIRRESERDCDTHHPALHHAVEVAGPW